MKWFLLFGVVICSTGSTSTPVRPAESLASVGERAMHNIAAGDWIAFRRDSAPGVCVEEYQRAYEDYFDKSKFDGASSEGYDERFITSVHWLNARVPLDKKGKVVFKKMQDIFKNRYSAYRTDAIDVSEDFGPWNGEASGLNGPFIGDKVASNLDCYLMMERSTGRWRVFRIVAAWH